MSQALRREVKRALPVGLALGVVAAGIYITQTIGLQTVPSPRAAFVTATYVLIVPLLSPLFKSGNPSKFEWISTATAIVGLFFLTNPQSERVGFGDVLMFCCALFVAMHIHFVQRVARNSYDPRALAFLQICGVGLSALFALPLTSIHHISTWGLNAWIGLLGCALVVTNGTFWLQAKFQRQSSPQRTAVIFALEPVFATLFAFAILGEGLSFRAMIGASILLGSLIIPRLFDGKHGSSRLRVIDFHSKTLSEKVGIAS